MYGARAIDDWNCWRLKKSKGLLDGSVSLVFPERIRQMGISECRISRSDNLDADGQTHDY
jgi:hypothetical protein